MLKLLAVSIVLVGVLGGGAAHGLDIVTCGQTVHGGEVGVLQTDLTCNGPSNFGVRLENGAVLDLGGHTLTLTTSSPIGVECLARCSVLGPGTLATSGLGPFGGGVVSAAKSRMTVTGVGLVGFAIAIQAQYGRLTLTDTTVSNSHQGVDGRRIDVDDVTIAITTLGDNPCISGYTGRVRGRNLALAGCGIGIQVGKAVDLTGLTWSGGVVGILAGRRVKLVDSSVTGGSLADIVSGRLPRLLDTSCDRSARVNSDGLIDTALAWGVCAND